MGAIAQNTREEHFRVFGLRRGFIERGHRIGGVVGAVGFVFFGGEVVLDFGEHHGAFHGREGAEVPAELLLRK